MTATKATRTTRRVLLAAAALLLTPAAQAGEWDLTLYAGYSLPNWEQQLFFDAPALTGLPGVQVVGASDLVLTASGGPAFGAALALGVAGPLAIEARIDSATIDLDTDGVRYQVRARDPIFGGQLNGTLSLGAGTFSLDRFNVLSLNLRLRSPGPVSVFASGGVSYLPRLESTGTVGLVLEVGGVPLPGLSGQLQVTALPTESQYRFGVNGGAGVRLQLSDSVGLLAEARGFGFRSYDLGFELTSSAVPQLEELVAGLDSVRFQPFYFHGAAALVISF